MRSIAVDQPITPPAVPSRPPPLQNRLDKGEAELTDADQAYADAVAKLEAANTAHAEAASAVAHAERNAGVPGLVSIKNANQTRVDLRTARDQRNDAESIVDAAEQHRDACRRALTDLEREVARADLQRLRRFISTDAPHSLEAAFAEAEVIAARLVRIREAFAVYAQVVSDACSAAHAAAKITDEPAQVAEPIFGSLLLEWCQSLMTSLHDVISESPSAVTSSPRDLQRMLEVWTVSQFRRPAA